MKLYQYTIRLLDSIYFAREGLTGAFTPHLLHGTAVNGALAAATNANSENQPFVISETNGGRNRPRYRNSCLADAFYATPAKLKNNRLFEHTEIAKGENDGFFQLHQRAPDKKRGLSRIDARTEPLRYCALQFLDPDTEFSGFLFLYDESLELPRIIRLGSFRTPCEFSAEESRSWRLKEDKCLTVDHHVDPLLAKVKRGTIMNTLPYGVVANAMVEGVYEAIFPDGPKRIANHDKTWRENQRERTEQELAQAKDALLAANSEHLSASEQAQILMRALRGLTSIALVLRHQVSQGALADALEKTEGFAELRSAVKTNKAADEKVRRKVHFRCESLIQEIEGKGTNKGTTEQQSQGLLQL